MECPPSDAPLGCSTHGSNTLLNLDALFAEGTPFSLDPHQGVLRGHVDFGTATTSSRFAVLL